MLVLRQPVPDLVPDMKFRNVKTGAVIEAPSMLGGNWELIGGEKSPKKETVIADVPAACEEAEVKPVKKTRKTTSTKKTTKK